MTESTTSNGIAEELPRSAVLITGAGGYIGSLLTEALAADRRHLKRIVAMDLRPIPAAEQRPGVEYVAMDIRAPELADLFATHEIDTVVHLAAIVTPTKGMTREFLYSVEVGGTENVLKACVAKGVRKFITTSSGAAYGYHADNPVLLKEDAPLRGNESFAYSYHKRLVEELLARYREEHPALKQLIFRPGAILGATVSNQITALFEKPLVFGIQGATTPFQFIWDQDVVNCLVKGVFEERDGIYNLSGDGILTLREIAGLLRKPFVSIPVGVLSQALSWMHAYDLTQYGPEQIDFLRYRPVLSNQRLKEEFGYVPKKSTREVFALYQAYHQGEQAFSLLEKVQRWTAQKLEQGDGVKNVVVTGGAGGIGQALARAYIKEGARVALLDKDAETLHALIRKLRAEGATVMGVPCDVCDPDACERAIEQVIDLWGGVDILINNAGVSHRSLFAETDAAVIRKIMEINFFGSVHCTQAALESLKARRGVIAAVSSVAGFAPLLGRTGYSASKHALHGFFDSLRAELHNTGVSVLLVCPSFTETGMEANALGGDGRPVSGKREIIGKMASPDEVAAEIVKAIKHRKKLLVLSPIGKLSYLTSRLFPGLYERIMRSSQSAEFQDKLG